MPRRQSERSLVPLLAGAVVALAGLAGLIYGTLLATTLAAPTHTVGRVSGIRGVPVVDTANGVLHLDGPQVEIRATAASGGPVFVGIARADDVTAYLADASRADITRVFGDGRLTTVRAGAQGSLPNPTAVDIWVTSRSGKGTVSLVWPDTPGPWRVVVAGDGITGAPAEITLDWSRAPRSNSAPAFVTVGLLLLAGGLLALLALRVRRRDIGEDDDAGADPAGVDRAPARVHGRRRSGRSGEEPTPTGGTPAPGETPAARGTPAAGGTPAAQGALAAGEAPAAQGTVAAGEAPAAQGTLAAGGTPAAQGALAAGEAPAAQGTLAAGGVPAAQGTAAQGTPAAGETAAVGETPATGLLRPVHVPPPGDRSGDRSDDPEVPA